MRCPALRVRLGVSAEWAEPATLFVQPAFVNIRSQLELDHLDLWTVRSLVIVRGPLAAARFSRRGNDDSQKDRLRRRGGWAENSD